MLTSDAPTRVQRASTEAGEAGRGAEFERRRQQRIIATGDAAAITLAFALVMSVTVAIGRIHGSEVLYTIAAGVLGLFSIRAQGLWRSPKIAVRWVELAGVAKASAFILGGVLVIDRLVGPALRLRWITAAAILAFVFLVLWRSLLRSWLTVNRRRGRMVQPTIVIGTDERAMEIVRIAEVHPETGTRVVGIVGSRLGAEAAGRADLWRGDLVDAEAVLAATNPERIIVSSGDIAPALLAGLIRAEHAGGAEVIIHAGLPGVDATRLTVSAIANEAVLHVDSIKPTWLARAFKRTFDVVVAGAALVVAAPVLAVLAILVKKEDGGPVFFRQQRVGLRRQRVRHAQVPHDVRGRRGQARRDAGRQPAHRPTVQAGPGPPGHQDRARPAPHQPRRAAAAAQRPQRRHEPGRPAPGPAQRGRGLPGRAARPSRRAARASPACGRSRPATTRRSTPTSASTSTTSRTGRRRSTS